MMAAMETPGSMTVICLHCKQSITLNQDNAETRRAGNDPHQQLRKHLAQASHFGFVTGQGRHYGWLIDMLCFRSESDPEVWRKRVHDLLDYFLREAA
jgi:hypothetical protein